MLTQPRVPTVKPSTCCPIRNCYSTTHPSLPQLPAGGICSLADIRVETRGVGFDELIEAIPDCNVVDVCPISGFVGGKIAGPLNAIIPICRRLRLSLRIIHVMIIAAIPRMSAPPTVLPIIEERSGPSDEDVRLFDDAV